MGAALEELAVLEERSELEEASELEEISVLKDDATNDELVRVMELDELKPLDTAIELEEREELELLTVMAERLAVVMAELVALDFVSFEPPPLPHALNSAIRGKPMSVFGLNIAFSLMNKSLKYLAGGKFKQSSKD